MIRSELDNNYEKCNVRITGDLEAVSKELYTIFECMRQNKMLVNVLNAVISESLDMCSESLSDCDEFIFSEISRILHKGKDGHKFHEH